MKILGIASHYPTSGRPRFYGGAEIAQKLFLETLAAAGHEVIAVRGGGPGESEELSGRVRVVSAPFPCATPPEDVGDLPTPSRLAWHLRDDHNSAILPALGDLLDRARPDVVLTGNLHGLSTAVWTAAAKRGVPVVHYLHDYYLTCHRSVRYRDDAPCRRSCPTCVCVTVQRRHATNMVGAVIGNSAFTLAEHLRLGLFQGAARFELAPFAHMEGQAQTKDHRPESAKVRLGFLGRPSPDKGLQRLIAARRRMLTPTELFIGAPLERDEIGIPSLIAGDPDAHILGLVTPDTFFPQIDLLVTPSLQNEPFGRVVMEARSYGVPVAASARGALLDLTPPEWRFDPDNIDGFAAILDRMCSSPVALAAEGERGRKLAEACTVDNIRAVFESAINAAMGRRASGAIRLALEGGPIPRPRSVG